MSSPNILLIVSDQHAQHASGCYGDPAGVTPELDRLAAGGVVFDNAYCPSPICGPSRMSMMTGLQPHENRCWLNGDILNSGTPTFAHALGAAGYTTALVGRMHFIGPDQTHGYDERAVGDHSANWPGNPSFDHGELRGTSGPDRVSFEKAGAGINAYDLKDRDTAAAAADWLRAAGKRRAAGDRQPFLLTVGFMLPHPPYVADPDDFDAMAGRVPPLRVPRGDQETEHPWVRDWRRERGIDDVGTAAVHRARQAYWGMVRRLDAHCGQVLAALDMAGLTDETVVIYVSDHGDHLGDRGLFWKHSFFDESVKVPFIMRWPGELAAGARRRHLISLTDLGAGLLDIAGGTWSGGGTSFLPIARDPDAPWADEVVSEYCQGVNDPWSAAAITLNRMIRRGRFKACYYHGQQMQLFDMESDPLEQTDLAGDPSYTSILKLMRARLLSDWDPDQIGRQIESRERDAAVLVEWAVRTHPTEQYRWSMPKGVVPSLRR